MYMYIVLSRCCPSGATCSNIYKGGEITPGAKGLIKRIEANKKGKKWERKNYIYIGFTSTLCLLRLMCILYILYL